MEGFKVLSQKEKEKIISIAQTYEASVYFKFSNTGVYKTNVAKVSSKRLLTCRRPKALPLIFSNKPVTMNFVINSEIYFLVSIVSIDNRRIHFNVDTDIFHLARRQNRRLQIPKEYSANLMIKRLAGQMAFLRGLILDLSPGGCRLALNTDVPLVQLDSIIEGTLKMGERHPLEVEAVVKYHKLYVRREHKQVFGVQFVNLSNFAQNRLQTMVVDLQREFFLRSLE